MDVVIKAEGISKKYCQSLKHTMLYGATDLTRRFLGMDQHTESLRSGEFWAVDDLSFELKRGECLGVIGPNGSGKSTLLKMLNGIFMPDKGEILINGRVGALIEVGAGFHPMLTGRENIYINGSILGLSKKEIDKKFDAIIDFAEIGDFIDAPVKHYSSGMHVRLGFAIAAQMEPDVLLIDEVLAVGDVGFRAKCFNAISKISKNAAIILVSHAMPQVARTCTDICVINQGKLLYQGKNVPKGIDYYYSQFEGQKGIITGNGDASIHSIEFESNGEKGIDQINYLDDLNIHLNLSVDKKVKKPIVGISFLSQELQIVSQCTSNFNNVCIDNTGDQIKIKLNLPKINFNPGYYFISVYVTDETFRDILIQHYAIKELKVQGNFVGLAPIQLTGEWDIQN
ncbi:MAG: ABC transporter ATP-binding protein [Nitrospirota bacterium]